MDDEYFSLESILADNHVSSPLPLAMATGPRKGSSLRIRGSTDHQKLSCTFTLDVPGLGYLEGGSENDVRLIQSCAPIRGPLRNGRSVVSRMAADDQIHQHQKLELPFWLAQTLSLKYASQTPNLRRRCLREDKKSLIQLANLPLFHYPLPTLPECALPSMQLNRV